MDGNYVHARAIKEGLGGVLEANAMDKFMERLYDERIGNFARAMDLPVQEICLSGPIPADWPRGVVSFQQ